MSGALQKEWSAASALSHKSKTGKRKSRRPISIRFSEEEWAALDRAAGDMPVGSFVRRKALDGLEVSRKTPDRRRARQRIPRSDETAISNMLGAFGRSRMSSNLNQLAHAANLGTLAVDPEVAQALTDACADVRAMRIDLIRALGLKAED